MQNIETEAINNYQDNMIYFEQKHPSLYNKILALDTILNDGSYPQKYDLEYKDGYFDVIDLNQNMLYNQNSKIFSKKICDKITLQKDVQSFKSYRKLNFDPDALKIYKTQNAYTDFISVADIFDYHDRYCQDSMSIDKINKYLFLGTGLGIHVEQIVNKFNIPVSLIIEDDVELFRLSMFTTNYKKLFQNRTVYFSISESKNEFHKTFNNFFVKAFFKNYFIKYSLFSNLYKEKVDDIRSFLIARSEATYSNERLLTKNRKVINKIKDNYKFLNLQKKDSQDFFKDKPILILGAGPSLHKNLEWLKKNHDKYIIIAVFVSLKVLKKANISPDFAVHIDERHDAISKVLEDIGDLSFLKNTLLIFSASVPDILIKKFDKEQIYLHEDRTKYKLRTSTLEVSSVGETVYSIGLILNPSSIYILGLDLALGDEGETHATDHIRSKQIKETNNENDDFQLENNVIYTKGNLKERVKTLPILALSIPVLNLKTLQYKSKDQNIFNLSQNGAFFENTTPLKISDIKITKSLDKNNLSKKIKTIVDSYSTKVLDHSQTEEIKPRIKQISDFKKTLETFRTSPHSNHDIFLISFEEFASSIFQNQYHYELWEILTIYLLRVGAYIDDFINTVNIKNKKKHAKKLKQFLITQLEKIILTYEEDLSILTKQ